MNKSLSMSVIAIIVLFLSTTNAAALEEPAVPVHLAQAVELAIKGRPESNLALEKENIAQSSTKEARGNFMPTLDASGASAFIESFDTFSGIDISAQVAGQDIHVNMQKEVPAYELIGELDFLYNLYAGGRDSALLGEALNNLEAAGHQKAVTLRKIRLEVGNAYWGLKKAQVRYLMAQRALEVVRLKMQVAQTEHRLVRRPDVGYEAVLLEGREKEVSLRTADRDCLRAYSNYQYAVGLSEEIACASCAQLPALADTPDDKAEVDGQPPVHPEILRLKSDLQAASQRKKAANAENLPKFDFFAKYSLIGRENDAYLDVWGDAHSDYYKVGLQVTVNLFNGFRTWERVRQAEGELRVKRLELMEKERELAQKQKDRQTELEAARDQLSLALTRKELAQAQEKSAESELNSGRISQLEYRQKSADAENAADEAAMARIDVTVAANALALMVLE